jgi:hypothetical protein
MAASLTLVTHCRQVFISGAVARAACADGAK